MIGKILGGRYEIMEQIGGGGMALVYKARCQLLDRFVAIKVLKDEFVNDEEFVRKFRRESQAAASLSHPNIVNIYDVGMETDEDKQIYYIVMEYIKGKTLKDIIRENGVLSIESAVDYSYQIAEALEHAHKNHLVHRDIKPHNIMVTDDNRVKVTDFGIARAATSSTMTTTSNVLGSVHYFSPEQARGGYTDEKSDIYSLGIVMYEMATGKLPFHGESPITVALKHVQEDIKPPREINGDISMNFEKIILKCVRKRQADRYSSANELIKDLKKLKDNTGDIVSEENNHDSYTKIIPVVDVEDEKILKNDKIKDKKKNKDGSGKVVFLGIFLAFLLASSMWLGYYKLKGLFISEEVIVPNILGVEEEEAKKEIISRGLKFEVVGRVKNSEYKDGEVASQSEEEGTRVKKGYTIEVTISEGNNLVSVVSVVNKHISDAEEILEEKGILAKIEYENSDTIPEDVVIRQDPEDGYIESGTKIKLVVSQGAEVEIVKMVKLIELTIEEAKKKITDLDLVVGEVREEPSDTIAKGKVTWQSYEIGTDLETKTTVDLYVSSGPEVPEEKEEEPEEDPEEKEGPITFLLTPLQDVDETAIKIIRIQDGETKIVYNKKHQASEGEFHQTFSGKKGSLFEIYYNEIYQTTIPKEE